MTKTEVEKQLKTIKEIKKQANILEKLNLDVVKQYGKLYKLLETIKDVQNKFPETINLISHNNVFIADEIDIIGEIQEEIDDEIIRLEAERNILSNQKSGRKSGRKKKKRKEGAVKRSKKNEKQKSNRKRKK